MAIMPKAIRKRMGEAVKISSGNAATDFLKLLSAACGSTVKSRIGGRELDKWERGSFGYEDHALSKGLDLRVWVSLTYRGSSRPVRASIDIPHEQLDDLSPSKARFWGKQLGIKLAREMKRSRENNDGGAKEKPPTQSQQLRPFRELLDASLAAKKVVDGYEDENEAIESKKPAPKKLRCKICGETDDKFPDWDDECNHTEEERNGE